MTAKEYIYAEPKVATREVYLDQNGKPHLDRDKAITANIRADLETVLHAQLARACFADPRERDFLARVLVGQLASRRSPLKEVVRALIESTD